MRDKSHLFQHKTAYQHRINLDIGYCQHVYEAVKHLAKVDLWAELMAKKDQDFPTLFAKWLEDYSNSQRFYISKFNNQKFLRIDGLVVDFLKVYLLHRDANFDRRVWFVLNKIVPMPPLPEPPEPIPPPPPCGDHDFRDHANCGADPTRRNEYR